MELTRREARWIARMKRKSFYRAVLARWQLIFLVVLVLVILVGSCADIAGSLSEIRSLAAKHDLSAGRGFIPSDTAPPSLVAALKVQVLLGSVQRRVFAGLLVGVVICFVWHVRSTGRLVLKLHDEVLRLESAESAPPTAKC